MAAKSVDEHRRDTAQARRGHIIRALSREMDPLEAGSVVSRFARMTYRDGSAPPPPRLIITSGDIDGLVSSMMIAKATDWRVAAIIIGSQDLLLHPDLASPRDLLSAGAFGVDVYSPLFPNASNHPVLWGTRRPLKGGPGSLEIAAAHDEEVQRRAGEHLVINASLWAGVEGGRTDDYSRITGARYKYPLGTAQLLLAVLEVAGRSPKMFDRGYLPWLIANCDGGLETIRDYPWNVPMWWSAVAAAVGPASLSEQIYRIASTQSPDEFLNVGNHLRAEVPEVAASLSDRWNLRTPTAEVFRVITEWIAGISGWPDPFLGGVEGLDGWARLPLVRGVLELRAQPAFPGTASPDEAFYWHLRAALEALYMSLTTFWDGTRMGWMLPDVANA